MKVSTERLGNCQINLIIELDAAEVEARLRDTARKISRQFTVPGYRRGKAPLQAVIRTFGREAVQQQTLQEFGNDWYEQAIKEIEYEPYQVGELKEVQWDPFRMTVLLPLKPEVDLGDYRAVRVPLEVEPVTDEQVQERLAELQRRYTQWVPVERPAAFGDKVIVDVEARVGDEVLLTKEEQEMLLRAGSAELLPGLHEQIVGLSPGEEKSLLLTVPAEGFRPDLAGQEAVVTVRLHTVRQEDMPPLDDELAMMVGDYDTLDALKAALREEMETAAQQRAQAGYPDKILEAIQEAAARIEYPPQAVDDEAELALERVGRNLASSGMDLDRFLAMIGKTREMYKQELRPTAEESLRKRLVLKEIIRREGLAVQEEEVDAEIARLIEASGQEADQMRDLLSSERGRMMVMEDLLLIQARERLVQIAKGEAPPLAEAEGREGAETAGGVEGEGEADVEATVAEATTGPVQEEVAEQPEGGEPA